MSLLFANNDIPHFLRIIIFFPALSPQSAETSAPFTQNIYKIRAGEEKEERNRIFFGSVRPPLWCLLPLKKHFLTDSEDGLPVGRSQKEAVRNNPVKLVGTQSQEFFFSFCGRKSNRTRGDGARRERTHQSRFMVFSTSRTTDPISLPVHTDFGGHFHSNERQICEKYWRICQSNFEFFKKTFFIHSSTGVTAKMCAPFEFLTGRPAIIWKKNICWSFWKKKRRCVSVAMATRR